ncbi:MAG: hypothetical protein A2097_10520 [Desulfobacula sp. GWF2_41_7]|nr:MAG: hypothetical protein A2097_10520 [Desulfobacula sp. GWF2_41_7]
MSICNSGFHLCENPIDIFSYYSPAESVFHTVSGHGKTVKQKHDEDSKVVCSEITIGASISLHDFIADGIKFFFNRKYSSNNTKHSTGDSSASSATGYSSASSATGDSSASSATGDSSASSATGYNSKARAGKYGCIALAFYNKTENRAEMRCAETGCGDGSDGKLKAMTWYKLDNAGNFIEY